MLLLVVLLLFCGCVRHTKTDPKTLVIGVEAEIRNLDPRVSTDLNSMQVIHLINQSLIRINEELLPEGELAETWESSDAKNYTFHLRKDAVFHDGVPLTCEDVRFTFEDSKSESSRSRTSFEIITSLECPDPHTFILRLKEPLASFLVADAMALQILPRHLAAQKDFGRHPVGSGPYKFVKQEGRDWVFERFESFRYSRGGKTLGPANFEKVIIRTVEDPLTRFLSLMGGDLDIVFSGITPRRVKEAEQNPFLRIYHLPGNNYQYLGFNFRNPKFKDPRVRRALALGIDREEIIRHKLAGFASPASTLLSPLNFFRNSQVPLLAYDPEQARRLLKEAGSENLEVELKTSTDRDIQSIMQVVQNQWARIGVHTALRPYEFGTFYSDIQKGNFEMFSLRWTQVVDPDIYYRIFHSKEVPPGRNRGFYANPKVDQLLEAGRREARPEARKKLYARLQELLAADLPYISLWYPDNIAVATSQLKGFVLHPTGSWFTILEARKETD